MEETINEVLELDTEFIEETEPIIVEKEEVEEITEEVPEETEPTENDILIEYIKQELQKNVEEETEEDTQILRDSDISQNDTLTLEDIQTQVTAIKNELIYQTSIYDDYNENNTLQSDINDISLNNVLLIILFISILFSALVNFSRRIF